MNEHLTEQQLIDYQFKLADEAGMDEARTHLKECDECRQSLQRLARKFAALDLLRDEIEVPEDLLSRTVENAVQARRGRTIWLYRVPALGAVAAAVITGAALLLVSNSGQDIRITPTVAPGPPAQNVAPAPTVDKEYAFRKEQTTSLVAGGAGKTEPAAPSKPSSFKMGLTEAQPSAIPRVVGKGALVSPEPVRLVTFAAQPPTTPEMTEQPPFAPASAIELVVLPRRRRAVR